MILFYVFIVLALVSGALGIRVKNPVHSVVFLILGFFNTSGLLVLLGLDFFAMFFLVVYVEVVFILFVVMMLHIRIEEIHENVLRYLPIGGFIGLIIFFLIF